MIHRPFEVILDDRQREQLQGYDLGFPYTAIDCHFDDYSGQFVDWHWHATLEVNICVSGVLKPARSAVSIWSGRATPCWSTPTCCTATRPTRARRACACRRICSTAPSSPPLNCPSGATWPRGGVYAAGRAAPLSRKREHRAVLEALDRAFEAASEEKDGYELEICGLLNRAWQGVYAQALPVIGARQPLPRMETARLKQMLGFIRDHYAEDISPADIAAAAGVCERECFRCFKQELGTTPLSSLTDFRVRKAAELLRETDRSVTDIAAACGFATPSYFGKVFRRRMNLSPLAYRRG